MDMSNTIELDEAEPPTKDDFNRRHTVVSARRRWSILSLIWACRRLCESYLTADQLNRMEPFYPLHVKVCGSCFLVQLEQYVSAEHIFTEYAYFSSYSDSWLKHSSNYVDMISERLALGTQSLAVELASNDGYLLQYFVKKGIPVLGVEPASTSPRPLNKKACPLWLSFSDVRPPGRWLRTVKQRTS